jgi:AcrR family transcriptional regulator
VYSHYGDKENLFLMVLRDTYDLMRERFAAVVDRTLSADDPDQAADHLSALTLGQLNNRSMMGLVPISDAEAEQIITSGIRVFLCAYGVSS